ncbi:MAG: hypothetical protein EOP11_26905 [Proteobacteria bacterium]|nr:MAG: hypothetical protein EOP11_26905 [Pseudomonadota bacterium]
MKFLILASLLLTPAAFASSLQETCGSSDGSIRTSGGHGPMFTEITVRDYAKNTEEKVRDEDFAWKVEELNRLEIKKENHGGQCRNGMRAPWGRTIYSREVRITKEDGSNFDKNTVGVSSDLKAVEAVLLCEHTYSNIMPCSN